MKIFSIWDKVNQCLVSTLIHALEVDENKNSRRYALIQYALSCIINEAEKIAILILVFGLQGQLIRFLIAFFTIASLRIFMGGSHRETILGCFLQSLLTFEAIVLMTNNIVINEAWNYVIYICNLIWIWKNAPIVSSKRASYNELQCMRFKTMAITVLLLLVMLVEIMPDSLANVVLWTMLFQWLESSVVVLQRRKEEQKDGCKNVCCE